MKHFGSKVVIYVAKLEFFLAPPTVIRVDEPERRCRETERSSLLDYVRRVKADCTKLWSVSLRDFYLSDSSLRLAA